MSASGGTSDDEYDVWASALGMAGADEDLPTKTASDVAFVGENEVLE